MEWQLVVVYIIGVVAVYFVVKRIVHSLKHKSGNTCEGCEGCSMHASTNHTPKSDKKSED